MRTAIKIIIRLDKQNTGFRFYAFKRGKELGIHGSIAYCGDNKCIVIHAEGKDCILQQYISILRQGTPFSNVTSLMSIPDRMLNSGYLELLPVLVPVARLQIEKYPFLKFKLGLFGL